MSEGTGASPHVNRQARKERELNFSALADFANLAETPAAWQRFRLKYPNFFPQSPSGSSEPGFRNLSDWLYTAAEEWHEMEPTVKTRVLTPLIWYRNRLRSVWSRNDAEGINLMFLLGFEKQAQEKGKASRSGGLIEGVVKPYFVPGQTDPLEQGTLGGLPQAEKQEMLGMLPGIPEVDGLRSEIRWKFHSEFQQAVYELMKHRWRAMVCRICGKFFVADKSAQKHCSPECYGEAKRIDSLERWHAKGAAEREAKRNAKPDGRPRKKRSGSASRKGSQ
jgi:hypothetical protein